MSCAGRICPVDRRAPAAAGIARPTSPHYHHHRLVLDADGQKLSKSTRATTLRALRDSGASPADIRRMIGLAELVRVLI
jgi:glutamyl/glutaminyl-tRNA synthetase